MKITSFNPLIVTKDAERVVQLFEELGFERKHRTTVADAANAVNVDMKNPDGFRVDVAQSEQLPQDMTLIRMNVDNFDEAYEILLAHGFRNTRGDGKVETGSSKAATMISPSGFVISLIQHIK